MLKKCVVCGKEFNSKNGIITCSDLCHGIRHKERLLKNELIRQNKLHRERKKCPICGNAFEVNKTHIKYCSAKCREISKKKILKKYHKNYYKENRDRIIKKRKKRL